MNVFSGDIKEKMIQKTPIVIDFDGTICEHKFPDIGEPTPDVREALETLKKAGYRIIIHTCRTASYWKGIIPVISRSLLRDL